MEDNKKKPIMNNSFKVLKYQQGTEVGYDEKVHPWLFCKFEFEGKEYDARLSVDVRVYPDGYDDSYDMISKSTNLNIYYNQKSVFKKHINNFEYNPFTKEKFMNEIDEFCKKMHNVREMLEEIGNAIANKPEVQRIANYWLKKGNELGENEEFFKQVAFGANVSFYNQLYTAFQNELGKIIYNRFKDMKKNTVKLDENALNNIIAECIKKVLNEGKCPKCGNNPCTCKDDEELEEDKCPKCGNEPCTCENDKELEEGFLQNVAAGAKAFMGKGMGNRPQDAQQNGLNLKNRWNAAKKNYNMRGQVDEIDKVIEFLSREVENGRINANTTVAQLIGGKINNNRFGALTGMKANRMSQGANAINKLYKEEE